MTSTEWAQLKAWFCDALALPPEARAPLLARCRSTSPELAAELESLLAAHDAHSLPTQGLIVQPAWARDAVAQEVVAGTLVGPYCIVRELGRGGAGSVFLAERSDDEFHRPVALKLLHASTLGDESRSGLTRERGSLARMQHANIAILLDWGTSDGVPWIVTEFVAGEPIDIYCRSHALSQRAILALFAQVTSAVSYAHGRGVVHRDLKPSNIFVRDDGVVKLLDFGIAQLAVAGADIAPERKFTPLYSSPEQESGAPPSAANDVYSLAVVLGQLLSGTLPPDWSRVERGVRAILRHALENNVTRRYADVASLRTDLARYLAHRPPRQCPTPWWRRVQLLFRRRWVPALAAVTAVSLLAGAWFWNYVAPEPERPQPALRFAPQAVGQASAPQPLVLPFPGVQGANVAVVTRGAVGLDFVSPDAAACGARFARGSACTLHVQFKPDSAGEHLGAVVVRDAAGAALRTLYIDGAGVGPSHPVWSAQSPQRRLRGLLLPRGLSTDGAGNAYFIQSRSGYVDELPAGSSRLRTLAAMPLIGGATAVDGAGNLYVASLADHGIYRIDAGRPVWIASLPGAEEQDDNLEADGAGNLYTSATNGAIFMIAAGTHRVRRLLAGGQGHRFVGMASDMGGLLYCADFLHNAIFVLPVGARALVRIVKPDGFLHLPHAIVLGPSGDILVGNDWPGGHVLRYAHGSWAASRLPILGNQSLAFDSHNDLFAIVNNNDVTAYEARIMPVRSSHP